MQVSMQSSRQVFLPKIIVQVIQQVAVHTVDLMIYPEILSSHHTFYFDSLNAVVSDEVMSSDSFLTTGRDTVATLAVVSQPLHMIRGGE